MIKYAVVSNSYQNRYKQALNIQLPSLNPISHGLFAGLISHGGGGQTCTPPPCISRTNHSLGVNMCTNMDQLLNNNFQPKISWPSIFLLTSAFPPQKSYIMTYFPCMKWFKSLTVDIMNTNTSKSQSWWFYKFLEFEEFDIRQRNARIPENIISYNYC